MVGINRARPITGARGREPERHGQGILLQLRHDKRGTGKRSPGERPHGAAFTANSGAEFGARRCCSGDLGQGAAARGSPRTLLLEGTVLPITPTQPPGAAASHAAITGGFLQHSSPEPCLRGAEPTAPWLRRRTPLLPPQPRNRGMDERGNNYPALVDEAMFANH